MGRPREPAGPSASPLRPRCRAGACSSRCDMPTSHDCSPPRTVPGGDADDSPAIRSIASAEERRCSRMSERHVSKRERMADRGSYAAGVARRARAGRERSRRRPHPAGPRRPPSRGTAPGPARHREWPSRACNRTLVDGQPALRQDQDPHDRFQRSPASPPAIALATRRSRHSGPASAPPDERSRDAPERGRAADIRGESRKWRIRGLSRLARLALPLRRQGCVADGGAWPPMSDSGRVATAGEMAAPRSMEQPAHAGDGLSRLARCERALEGGRRSSNA